MKTMGAWVSDIKYRFMREQIFLDLADNVNFNKVISLFEGMKFYVGDITTYYYYDDGCVESRGNIYYSNIGLFKICIKVLVSDEVVGDIKIEKIRRSENHLERIQDIGDQLNENWDIMFEKKFYDWNENSFNSFIDDIEKLKETVDTYTGNFNKISDTELILNEIHVYNFKKITKAKVNMSNNLSILVGLNNAGKSSFIQGVVMGYQALFSLYKNQRIKYDIYGQVCFDSQPSIRIEKFPFLLGNLSDLFNKNVRASMSKGLPLFRFEFDNNLYIEVNGRLVGEVFSVYIGDCSKGITKNSLKNFLDRPITLIPSFFNVVINEERKSPARYNSMLKTGNYNQLFRNILLDLKEKNKEDIFEDPMIDKFYKLQQLVEKVFDIKDLDVEFIPEDHEYISATYKVEKSDGKSYERIDISTLGMGTLQFIQVVAQVLLGNPIIILLDEPDAHLHSKLQVQIINLFKEFSDEYDVKFLIATHSKDIINSVNPRNVLSFNDKSELVNIDSNGGFIDVMKSLGATTEEIIGLNIGKRIVIVEGDDDSLYIRKLCDKFKISQKANYNLINFIPVGGRQNVLSNQMNKFLTEVNDLDDFYKVAVFDRDYRFEEQQTEDAEKLRKKGFEVIEWTKKELENYLLVPNRIASVINEKYPQGSTIFPQQIEKIIEDVYMESKDDIIFEFEKIIELREKRKIEKSTNDKYEDIVLKKESQIKCRKEARTYVEDQIKSNIICGKEVLKRIRTDLILIKTPTKDEFVLDIISALDKADLDDEMRHLLETLEGISS